MIVPTRRFWWLIGGGLLLALGGMVVPGLEWLLIPYNLLLFTALYVTGKTARGGFIQVDRRTDPVLSVRVPNTVRLRVENQSDQPVHLLLRDEPPPGCTVTKHEYDLQLAAGQSRDLKYSVTPYERGRDEFEGTYLRWKAPLGLCWIQEKLPNSQEARIYPNVKALADYELLKQKGHLQLMGVRRSRIKGLGMEFESLREYNEDDVRIVDWKASARRGKLVVRNFEVERNQSVIVCFDIGRHMLGEVEGVKKLDLALDAGLMLMHAAQKAGDQVGLMIFDDIVHRWIEPKKGRTQVSALLDTISAITAEPIQPNYEAAFARLATSWKRRSLIVLFTDAENEDQARDLQRALAPLQKRHLIMIVRVSDPRLKELRQSDIKDMDDVFQRASAVWYARDRREAEKRLSHGGLQSLEAEPEDLSAALVTAYLHVKELNLI